MLLWTYFRECGLRRVEDELRRTGKQPASHGSKALLEGAHEHLLEALQSARDDLPRFDHLAIDRLRALDDALKSGPPISATFDGIDRAPYWLKRRKNLIAERVGERRPTWAEGQSATLHLYGRHHLVVPAGPSSGVRIEARAAHEWAGRAVADRLEAAQDDFSVLICPLPAAKPAFENDGDAFVSLRAMENEAELLPAIDAALVEAQRRKSTLLLFPELMFTPAMDAHLVAALKKRGPLAYPLLTCVGRCHLRPPELHPLELNVAAIYGPHGETLHEHRKLAPFKNRAGASERLSCGTVITVLESAIGNLAPLICLDFIHTEVRQLLARSHASIAVVPALSETMSAHEHAAKDLQVSMLLNSFIANFGPQDAPSFYRVCIRGSSAWAQHSLEKSPWLEFRLNDLTT